MTVIEPTIEDCEECGSQEMSAEVMINFSIRTDGEGGIESADPSLDSFGAFEHLECAECGMVFIENGDWV